MDVRSASSMLVSRILDDLGYNQQMVKLRQRFWKKRESLNEIFYSFFAGSKGEGLTRPLENDMDCLIADLFILSTSRNPVLYNKAENLTVLRLDRTNTSPGYTRLILVKTGLDICSALVESLTEPIGGRIYMSSDVWREKMGNIYKKKIQRYEPGDITYHPYKGPSQPSSINKLGACRDCVFGIVCDCPDILQPWLNRYRRYAWPSAEIIAEICNMEAHVVPVGFKGSPTAFLEWRICFTRAEMRLIQGFNDCQIKLIILLKAIAKDSLKPVCKEMTSYVMKNVAFWVAELNPPELFTEHNLFSTLQAALMFLNGCLKARHLPSYMIPERNLLIDIFAQENRSGPSTCAKLCDVIDVLLQEGPSVFAKCEKIRNAVNLWQTSTEMYDFFIKTSKKFEIIYMLGMLCRDGDDLEENVRKQLTDQLNALKHAILCPDIRRLACLAENESMELIRKRRIFFLS